MRWQPPFHSHLGKRFPHCSREYSGRASRNDRAAGAVLLVHRPAVCAHWFEREGSQRTWYFLCPGEIPLGVVFRAQTLSETRGFMKALIDSTSERILGFSAFGAEAGEVMATVQVAMIAGLPFTALRDAIFAHPTMAEGLIPLFSNVPP